MSIFGIQFRSKIGGTGCLEPSFCAPQKPGWIVQRLKRCFLMTVAVSQKNAIKNVENHVARRTTARIIVAKIQIVRLKVQLSEVKEFCDHGQLTDVIAMVVNRHRCANKPVAIATENQKLSTVDQQIVEASL